MTDPEKNLLRMIERNSFWNGFGFGLIASALILLVILLISI